MPTGIRLPEEIKAVNADGFSDTYEETRTNVEMQTGPARVRNKTRVAPRIHNIQMLLDQTNYQIFDIWWQETINGGEKEFDIQLLDDTEDLMWFTGRWVKGTYTVTRDNTKREWTVSGSIRSIEAPFLNRPAGTDTLRTRTRFNTKVTGALLVSKPLYGRSSVGISATGRLEILPFYGRASIKLSSKTKIRELALRGKINLYLISNGDIN